MEKGRVGESLVFWLQTLMHTRTVSVNHYLFIQPNERGNAEGLPGTVTANAIVASPEPLCFQVSEM